MSAISLLRSLLRKLRDDTEGATIVEFALVALPMCILLMGGLDLAYQAYVRSLMQGALNDAARQAAVQSPDFTAEGDSVKEQIENYMRNVVGAAAMDAEIDVDQKSYFDFSDIENPEKLMTDNNGNGQFDADDEDCWEDLNGNGEYDTDGGDEGRGDANDVVFYTASITMPRLLPWHGFTKTLPENIEMELKTAVRNQPYRNQPQPAIECAPPA